MPRPKKQDTPTKETAPTSEAHDAAPAEAGSSGAAALTKIEAELAALAPEQISPITIDVQAAVATVLAAAPRIHEHRAAIAAELPKMPIRWVDDLETYARAAWHAHLVETYASAGPDASKALIEEANKLREGLLIAAEALAHRNLLDADAVADVRRGSGDMGADLSRLAALFSTSWGKVSAKTAVERHEIDRARELGPAVAVVESIQKRPASAGGDQNARAFSLLSRAYDQCRRAIAYLRWAEGDMESIAPSIFRKKPGRKPGKREEGEPEADAAASASAEAAG